MGRSHGHLGVCSCRYLNVYASHAGTFEMALLGYAAGYQAYVQPPSSANSSVNVSAAAELSAQELRVEGVGHDLLVDYYGDDAVPPLPHDPLLGLERTTGARTGSATRRRWTRRSSRLFRSSATRAARSRTPAATSTCTALSRPPGAPFPCPSLQAHGVDGIAPVSALSKQYFQWPWRECSAIPFRRWTCSVRMTDPFAWHVVCTIPHSSY